MPKATPNNTNLSSTVNNTNASDNINGGAGKRHAKAADSRRKAANALANRKFREKRKEECERMRQQIHFLTLQVADVWSHSERMIQRKKVSIEAVDKAINIMMASPSNEGCNSQTRNDICKTCIYIYISMFACLCIHT